MADTRKRLGDLLVEAGLITRDMLDDVLVGKERGQKLGDALLERGYITERQLIEVLEFQLGIPHVSLYNYKIDYSLTSIVPKNIAKLNILMPYKKFGDKLFIAMADPMDFHVIEELRLSTGFQIEAAIAAKEDIKQMISKYYEIDESMEELQRRLPLDGVPHDDQVTETDSPVVKIVNQILLHAVNHRASDVHIDAHESKLIVRYRVDGRLTTERVLPKNMQSVLTARIKIISNLNITESRIPQDGRVKITLDSRPIDLRVSILPTIFGEKIVMRILDLSITLDDLRKLDFTEENYQQMTRLIENPNGMILITGPTGSGKTSTLYGALKKLNTEEVNILTIEDPVEYQLEGVNQLQVHPKVGLTFSAGLRSILRQDPNIIMVGEIRDAETTQIAVRASLTGHLVLSTIHTNDSISTINRLSDMDVEPFLIASSLSGVVAQRLVRRVCRDCMIRHEPSDREKEIFKNRGMTLGEVVRGKGCPTCNMTGYKGRLAIHEILVVDDEIRKIAMNHLSVSAVRAYVESKQMKFLIDDGLLKVKQGMTTTEEVLRVALNEQVMT